MTKEASVKVITRTAPTKLERQYQNLLKNVKKPANGNTQLIKPKRYGAINENGVLHDDVLSELSELGKEKDIVTNKIKEYLSDFISYGSKYYPEWSIELKQKHSEFLNDTWKMLDIINKYDWLGKKSVKLTSSDSWTLYNMFCESYRYKTVDDQNNFDNFWMGLAEITGYHKVKEKGDYLCSSEIREAFHVKELITHVLMTFKECEDDGDYQRRVNRTEARMNGNYMDDGSSNAIKEGDLLRLRHIPYSDYAKQLTPRQLVAVDGQETENGQNKKHFTIGWVITYENDDFSNTHLSLRYGNSRKVTIKRKEINAIYLVEKQNEGCY